jgi:hypothetical protein
VHDDGEQACGESRQQQLPPAHLGSADQRSGRSG